MRNTRPDKHVAMHFLLVTALWTSSACVRRMDDHGRLRQWPALPHRPIVRGEPARVYQRHLR